MAATVRRASGDDLAALAALFDGYRQFYRQPSDEARARAFIGERLAKGDSTILIAEAEGEPAGFTQLYPSFSSVSTGPILILNDLYVDPAYRGTGAGGALLDAAVDYGRGQGALRLTLTTEHRNAQAQAVYEAKGWIADTAFKTYNFSLTDS